MNCTVYYLLFGLAVWLGQVVSAWGSVVNDPLNHTVMLADGQSNLCLRLNYDRCCYLDRVLVRGREVISPVTGVCSAILTGGRWATTRSGIQSPTVHVQGSEVLVDDIVFSGGGMAVREQWRFEVDDDHIDWQITRKYLNGGTIDDTCFPGWDFAANDTWTGGLLDTGGVAWCRYLSVGSSYGAHAGRVTFFNPAAGSCLRITPSVAPGIFTAARFSHQPSGQFSFLQYFNSSEFTPKYDLRRFSRSLDMWAPFRVEPGSVVVDLKLEALDDKTVRGRGTLAGLDGGAIGDLLDTIGRYGVIDRHIMGGNGWLSGFVCLHEPFFAEMGLAIDNTDYTRNLTTALNDWRDHAEQSDGRIKSRWSYDAGDAMPGTYDRFGFYEAQWGYLLDSQPDYVMNVAEEFDLTGDIGWLRAHKEPCERALDWLLARDTDGNGLVKMMNDSHTQGKSSDWIDIVWASYENALVNAEFYEAMTLWSEREKILGDLVKAARYKAAAEKLKEAFRRPVSEGGFWNPEHGWFVYWREADGSIHGDNLVIPVNFCAVAYGLADDAQQKSVLEGMENRMRQEKLFHWPLCFLPYAAGEGAAKTFPEYENGDIFLSWGEVAVRSYASYDPEIAVAYVRRVLKRYRQDGLSFQRCLRADQKGAGDDILAGNCMTIVGLYRDIYGIRPQWNRLELDPHLTPELDGTMLSYRLRAQDYELTLGTNECSMSVGGFTVRAGGPFAVSVVGDEVNCFQGSLEQPALTITRKAAHSVRVTINEWPGAIGEECRWVVAYSGPPVGLHMVINGLRPRTVYRLQINDTTKPALVANGEGRVAMDYPEGQMKEASFDLMPAGK